MFKNAWLFSSIPTYDFMALWLIKHSKNFTCTFHS